MIKPYSLSQRKTGETHYKKLGFFIQRNCFSYDVETTQKYNLDFAECDRKIFKCYPWLQLDINISLSKSNQFKDFEFAYLILNDDINLEDYLLE